MLEIFSEQYKYSVLHVHLVAILQIQILYENTWNINLHDKITESSAPPLQYELTSGETSRSSD
jgi:hypothetical protein